MGQGHELAAGALARCAYSDQVSRRAAQFPEFSDFASRASVDNYWKPENSGSAITQDKITVRFFTQQFRHMNWPGLGRRWLTIAQQLASIFALRVHTAKILTKTTRFELHLIVAFIVLQNRSVIPFNLEGAGFNFTARAIGVITADVQFVFRQPSKRPSCCYTGYKRRFDCIDANSAASACSSLSSETSTASSPAPTARSLCNARLLANYSQNIRENTGLTGAHLHVTAAGRTCNGRRRRIIRAHTAFSDRQPRSKQQSSLHRMYQVLQSSWHDPGRSHRGFPPNLS